MLNWLKRLFKKSQDPAPSVRRGGAEWDTPGFIDAYKRVRPPSSLELLQELKNTAYTCATLNAQTCASYPPRLYVRTFSGQPAPKCLTKALPPTHPLVVSQKGMATVEEVQAHPLLTLLDQVNPKHNAYDLWELTTLYQEVNGNCYWLIEAGPLGIPSNIWPLPAHQVTPVRKSRSSMIVDFYLYRNGSETKELAPEEIIHFCYPDPKDPYGPGLSPLRACFELVALSSQYMAYKRAIVDNHAMPSAIVSPEEVISEEEADRLEAKWWQKFRRGGNGRVLVAESKMAVDVIGSQLGDVAALVELGATKEETANAFLVPLSMLSTDTNLANLTAAERQHAKAIYAKLQRRDQKINERLVPLYDQSGRLFVASDDPRPEDRVYRMQQEDQDLKRGVRTINEIRRERGFEPVPWGDEPYKPNVADSQDNPLKPAQE